MSIKRMRVFAGPNGSGKTTVFRGLLESSKISLGIYVNADDIEKEFYVSNSLSLEQYQLSISIDQVQDFFRQSSFSPVKRNELDLWQKIQIAENKIILSTTIDSYIAADIAEFIRQRLLAEGISFTYETVMSHPDKIKFLKVAKNSGYRVYLYFVSTEDPEININRVNIRVAQKGHDVLNNIIKERYYKSLKNLKSAVKESSRAFIFDNSQNHINLIAEITDGIDVAINQTLNVPTWVSEYLLDKQ
jgi:predicted ABC-type ATPase